MSRAHPPLALLAAAAALACGANHADQDGGADRPAPAAAARDTIRGVVAITGADPLTRVVIRTDDGRTVAVTGALADTLRHAVGLEVRIAGPPVAEALEGRDLRVRGLDGMPAADGRLELDGDTAILVMVDGSRLRYPAAPDALRRLAGRRVWIAGEPGQEPQQWGSLEP